MKAILALLLVLNSLYAFSGEEFSCRLNYDEPKAVTLLKEAEVMVRSAACEKSKTINDYSFESCNFYRSCSKAVLNISAFKDLKNRTLQQHFKPLFGSDIAIKYAKGKLIKDRSEIEKFKLIREYAAISGINLPRKEQCEERKTTDEKKYANCATIIDLSFSKLDNSVTMEKLGDVYRNAKGHVLSGTDKFLDDMSINVARTMRADGEFFDSIFKKIKDRKFVKASLEKYKNEGKLDPIVARILDDNSGTLLDEFISKIKKSPKNKYTEALNLYRKEKALELFSEENCKKIPSTMKICEVAQELASGNRCAISPIAKKEMKEIFNDSLEDFIKAPSSEDEMDGGFYGNNLEALKRSKIDGTADEFFALMKSYRCYLLSSYPAEGENSRCVPRSNENTSSQQNSGTRDAYPDYSISRNGGGWTSSSSSVVRSDPFISNFAENYSEQLVSPNRSIDPSRKVSFTDDLPARDKIADNQSSLGAKENNIENNNTNRFDSNVLQGDGSQDNLGKSFEKLNNEKENSYVGHEMGQVNALQEKVDGLTSKILEAENIQKNESANRANQRNKNVRSEDRFSDDENELSSASTDKENIAQNFENTDQSSNEELKKLKEELEKTKEELKTLKTTAGFKANTSIVKENNTRAADDSNTYQRMQAQQQDYINRQLLDNAASEARARELAAGFRPNIGNNQSNAIGTGVAKVSLPKNAEKLGGQEKGINGEIKLTLTKIDVNDTQKEIEAISAEITKNNGNSFMIEEKGLVYEIVPTKDGDTILFSDDGKPKFKKKLLGKVSEVNKKFKDKKFNRVPASIQSSAELKKSDDGLDPAVRKRQLDQILYGN